MLKNKFKHIPSISIPRCTVVGSLVAMAPPKATNRTISQEAFDEMVKENIEDLGMDPTEALQDALETLTLQGVDLSGPLHAHSYAFYSNGYSLTSCLINCIYHVFICRHHQMRSGRDRGERQPCDKVFGLFETIGV